MERNRREEVEVAPGKWVAIDRTDWSYDESLSVGMELSEKTWLRIPWGSGEVLWEGVDVPLSLREWEGRLFLIGFDRETDHEKPRLRYYRQAGMSFDEIKPADYPKRIATQNMWLKADSFSIGVDGKRHYDLEMARRLDVEDIYFFGSLTAHIWAHLSTGKDYYEHAVDMDPESVRKFKEEYKPIPLPTIIKTPSAEDTEKPAGDPSGAVEGVHNPAVGG